MISTDGTVLYSASDIAAMSVCEFAVVRRLDAKLGRVPALPEVNDPLLERAARLGDAHEVEALRDFERRFGLWQPGRHGGVASVERAETFSTDALLEGQRETLDALRGGADVVFQGTFFDGRFLGYADFLVRGEDGRVEVFDTKLARRAKVSALLQVAAYADQLDRLGVPTGERVHLLLGNGLTSSHELRDILPVFHQRRAYVERLFDERLIAGRAAEWGDPRFPACGRCEVCQPEVAAANDIILVAGMRLAQRARLLEHGVRTVDQLARLDGPLPGIPPQTLANLVDQAAMQSETAAGGAAFRMYDDTAILALPRPDPADLFFDFEGDPLYSEHDDATGTADWGLDYLFGVVEHAEGPSGTHFVSFWAHDYAEERIALEQFLDYAIARFRANPGMHIYHYANYERAHLQALCARHGVGEQLLDELLRNEVLVDLYPVVKRSVRIGAGSYSLKKLEPLYMGDELRESEVTNAGDSIDAYVRFAGLRAQGDADAAQEVLAEIADYNRYDCVSTLGLRDWLLSLVDPQRRADRLEHVERFREALHEAVARFDERSATQEGLSALAARLADEEAAVPPVLTNTATDAVTPSRFAAMAAAALGYHQRENKVFWWEHFARLEQPLEEWADTRDVLVFTDVTVSAPWHREERWRADRRELTAHGILAPGSRVNAGDRGQFLVYEPPAPWDPDAPIPGRRVVHSRTTLREVRDEASGETSYVLEEGGTPESPSYDAVPLAMTPAAPPPARALERALEEWGERVLDSAGRRAFPHDAATDILLRRPPRTSAPVPTGGVGGIDGVTLAVRNLEQSYIAVQGPPGTGKTYTGARVIQRLVRELGWKVGVVAQSHEVVENMLDAVVEAGVDPAHVGKARPRSASFRFTALGDNDHQDFVGAHRSAGRGAVIGGTAWDFCNLNRIGRAELDLLVIDEAGQFSLANTIAVACAARNLLLLGDPGQLPQVSQGIHPQPVDQSALGWLTAGHDVIPSDRGFFLAETWRMHPELCAPVSRLSYDGELVSHTAVTAARSLEGVAPGLHVLPIDHRDNSTSSQDEAEAVGTIVLDLIGRRWRGAAHGDARPLEARDIIVVAPYNAQVDTIRKELAHRGHPDVPVGTVDRFQGREAAIAIVSLAASSADDVPRGLSFLLMKNRVNVALSRAQWASYLVHSPRLGDHFPHTVTDLSTLAGFLTLTAAD